MVYSLLFISFLLIEASLVMMLFLPLSIYNIVLFAAGIIFYVFWLLKSNLLLLDHKKVSCFKRRGVRVKLGISIVLTGSTLAQMNVFSSGYVSNYTIFNSSLISGVLFTGFGIYIVFKEIKGKQIQKKG